MGFRVTHDKVNGSDASQALHKQSGCVIPIVRQGGVYEFVFETANYKDVAASSFHGAGSQP